MSPRQIMAAGIAALLLTTSASAQSARSLEFGAYGDYTSFGDVLPFTEGFGLGGRLGFFLLSPLALEAAASIATGSEVTYVPIRARLIYNQRLFGGVALLAGAGYVRSMYSLDGVSFSDNGVGGLLGLRLNVGRRLALRIDGTADYLPEFSGVAISTKDKMNLGFEAGFSVFFGGSRTGYDDWDDDDWVAQRNAEEAQPEPVAAPIEATAAPASTAAPAAPAAAAAAAAAAVVPAPVPADDDSDGVLNDADRCPGTATGEAVDGAGCAIPSDGDFDGVPDSMDRCPASASGETVDATGCAIPKDSDFDGVLDSMDRCPATAMGEAVDATGCAVRTETDVAGATAGAGIAAGVVGIAATDDDDGCTDCSALLGDGSAPVILEGVTFKRGKWELGPEAQRVLDDVAALLLANPSMQLEIAGYTDNTDTQRKSVWLSLTRAEAVKLHLRRKGVAQERLVTRGFGPDNPIASNASAEGRAKNQRIEVRILD